MSFILKLLLNAGALWLAAWLIDGIELTDSILGILLVALIFGLVNAFIRPVIKLFSLPVLVITLGLFTFVINAALLGLTALVSGDNLNIPGGFLAALLGALIISVVSFLLDRFVED